MRLEFVAHRLARETVSTHPIAEGYHSLCGKRLEQQYLLRLALALCLAFLHCIGLNLPVHNSKPFRARQLAMC